MNTKHDGKTVDPPRKRRQSKDGQRRVTMTDIARVALCSQATVSFVLNRTEGVSISDATRARVIEAARALNYSPTNLAHRASSEPASAGTGGREQIIGFVVDQLATSPEAVVAIDGVRQAVQDEEWLVMIAQTMNDPDVEERTVRALVDGGAGALVYMTIFTREITIPRWMKTVDVPVVLLNCYGKDTMLPAVIPDELAGGARATRHFLDHGHRRIAIITGEPWMEAARDRLEGYRSALDKAGIDLDPDLVIEGDWSPSAGYDATCKLLAMKHRPTAIFCQNDRMAIGCYEAIKEAGLTIPDDMSVIGYDDEEISRHLHPQLTTLVLPQRAMGIWAVAQIRNAGKAKRCRALVHLDCTLVERRSVATVTSQNSVWKLDRKKKGRSSDR